jgi:pimeloyl-ACP methyl ester carboxylesterase
MPQFLPELVRRVRLAAITAVCLASCSGSSAQGPSSQPPAQTAAVALQFPALSLEGPVRPGYWAAYRVVTPARSVRVYLAHDLKPKPVVLFIHGSGCAPLVTVDPDGRIHDTTLIQDLIPPRLDRLHFAIVEKRGVAPLGFSAGMSHGDKSKAFERAEQECTTEYLQNVTKQARVEDVAATLRALARQPWVSQVILAGHSEGTHVATGVLRAVRETRIAAAGLFASAGPIPFYGGYVSGGIDDREHFRSTFDRVRMLQHAADDFMYKGLPARRWKTFWLESTPIEDVRDSTVPLFVAQGTRDDTTLSADLFALEAIRQQPDRSLRYVVVEQGDHGFETPDGKSHLIALFDDFVRWAQDPNRATGPGVIR